MIHTTPMGEISAVWRGRGEKFVSDNSKCIGDPHGVGGGGVGGLTSNFLNGGRYGCFLE